MRHGQPLVAGVSDPPSRDSACGTLATSGARNITEHRAPLERPSTDALARPLIRVTRPIGGDRCARTPHTFRKLSST